MVRPINFCSQRPPCQLPHRRVLQFKEACASNPLTPFLPHPSRNTATTTLPPSSQGSGSWRGPSSRQQKAPPALIPPAALAASFLRQTAVARAAAAPREGMACIGRRVEKSSRSHLPFCTHRAPPAPRATQSDENVRLRQEVLQLKRGARLGPVHRAVIVSAPPPPPPPQPLPLCATAASA